jgi:hypothetical protein
VHVRGRVCERTRIVIIIIEADVYERASEDSDVFTVASCVCERTRMWV